MDFYAFNSFFTSYIFVYMMLTNNIIAEISKISCLAKTPTQNNMFEFVIFQRIENSSNFQYLRYLPHLFGRFSIDFRRLKQHFFFVQALTFYIYYPYVSTVAQNYKHMIWCAVLKIVVNDFSLIENAVSACFA